MVPKRVLITRSPHQSSELAEALRALGMEPILIPTIEIAPPTTYAPLDAALANLSAFHWLLFTSANAVEAFATRWSRSAANPVLQNSAANPVLQNSAANPVLQNSATNPVLQDSATNQVPQGFSLGSHRPEERGALAPGVCFPPKLQVAAIGPATARALEAVGLTPTLVPEKAIAESLAESLLPQAHQPDNTPTRFLLIRAETARDHLPETLRAAGAEVSIAPAYKTVIPESSIAALRDLFRTPETYPDAITFTSSSTAHNLLALLKSANLTLPPTILRASIGPITTQTLQALGYPPDTEASEATVASLASALTQKLINK